MHPNSKSICSCTIASLICMAPVSHNEMQPSSQAVWLVRMRCVIEPYLYALFKANVLGCPALLFRAEALQVGQYGIHVIKRHWCIVDCHCCAIRP